MAEGETEAGKAKWLHRALWPTSGRAEIQTIYLIAMTLTSTREPPSMELKLGHKGLHLIAGRSHSHPGRGIAITFFILQMRNRDSERLSNVPKVTQQGE